MGRFAAPRPFLARLRRASIARAGALGRMAGPAVTAAVGLAAPAAWAQAPRPVGGEVRVNAHTTGSQHRPRVARDADGDYVVVWQSFGQDGANYGVFARRYAADGVAQGAEVQVATFSPGFQGLPAVGIDRDGDFVVAWQSAGQDGSEYGVYARRFAANGAPAGGEFRVNATTSGFQGTPSVAMEASGGFVVAWESGGQDGSGYGVYARRYTADGTAQGGEIGVNTATVNDQIAPSVAMDGAGGFTVAWTSAGPSEDGVGVYAQRFAASGAPLGGEVHVNTTITGNQTAPSVAMDANGAAVVAWMSAEQDGDGYGVYARRYAAGGTPVGGEFPVSTTTTGNQSFPVVAMDAGGAVVVWTSDGQDGSNVGIYAQRFATSGAPLGGEFRANTYTTGHQAAPAVATDADGDLVVAWASVGQDGAGYGVYAQRFQGPNRPIAVAVFGTPGAEAPVNTRTTGFQSAPSVAADAGGGHVVVWQSDGQDGDGYGVYGQRYAAGGAPVGAEFRVNTTTTNDQLAPAVAMDADGDFVVAWTSYGQDGDNSGVYARRFAAGGAPMGGEFLVTTTTSNRQLDPAVAMDAAGDFVVAWTSYGQDGSSSAVYVQRYAVGGSRAGTETRVNTYTTDFQGAPAVAMDADGAVVVAWTSRGQDGDEYGVYARRYADGGTPMGGEVRVNTRTSGVQSAPAVAMAADGGFVVAWESAGQDGSGYGVYAQRYAPGGAPTGTEFRVNTFTVGVQRTPAVAVDAAGDMVVVWESYGQDAPDGYGVYTRRFASDGAPLGEEVAVNTFTAGFQLAPAVTMDPDGDVVAVWASDGQDGNGYGVFARRFPGARAAVTAELRGGEGWRLLAAPTATATVGDVLGPVWTQGFPGADAPFGGSNVLRYDETAAGTLSAGYTSPASAAEVMGAGRGYLTYVYADDDQDGTPEGFPKALMVYGEAPAGPVALPVTYTTTADGDAVDGWNLVGNPYRQSIDWDLAVRTDVASSAYVYDPALPGYRVWNGVVGSLPGGVVTALQGFWVKAMDTNGSGGVTPSATVPTGAQVPEQGQFYGRTGGGEEAPAASVLALSLTRGEGGYGREGQAFVSFEAGAAAGLDAADAYQLDPAAPDYTALFTRAADGTPLAIQALPETAGTYTLPLEVAAVEGGAPVGGAFTLAWAAPALPAGLRARLVDAVTGASADLTTAGHYTFTLDAPAARTAAAAEASALTPPAPHVLGASGAGLLSGRFSIVVESAVTAAEPGASILALTVAPNPMTGSGLVRYVLPEATRVRVALYDVLGREVAVLADAEQGAGRYDVALDAGSLAPGAYLVRLTAGEAALVRRVTVAR
ncbi:MAG TPA: T9SS type A sorting domain-containing protein [Rhodothermales bacterium]|nr:T9SS type A sorting domain-containing protein [Rhodothermales bacterium]